MVGSKLTCPKWHFGQVGHGGKKTIRGEGVLLKFLVKKVEISYSVWTISFTNWTYFLIIGSFISKLQF